MALHHPIPCGYSDHVAGPHTQVGIDLQVHIHRHQIAHLACAHIMDGPDARCARQGVNNCLALLLIACGLALIAGTVVRRGEAANRRA